MGGIVTQIQRHHGEEASLRALSDKVGQSLKGGEISLTLDDFPLLSFEEVQELLPLCLKSWNNIAKTRVCGYLLRDIFQLNVWEALRVSKHESAKAIEDMLQDARVKKLFDPITHVMKYCIKARRPNEAQFKKKLLLLGREHARIGVHADMITHFCMVLLTALARCFVEEPAADVIIYAWVANLKYIVTHMTNLRFSFLRVISGEFQGSGDCGSISSPSSYDAAGSTIEFALSRSSSVSRDNLLRFAHDGLDHSCHPIFEGYSGKDASFLYQNETNMFVPVAGPQSKLCKRN
jgi:hypothetical protein